MSGGNGSAQWAYTQYSRSWYGRQMCAGGVVDEVTFGLYEDGCIGEMSMQWKTLGRETVPKLGMFSDCWHLLGCDAVRRVLDELSRQGQNLSPSEFCRLLDRCGFVDQTETEPPISMRDAPFADVRHALNQARTAEDADRILETFLQRQSLGPVATAWAERRRRG